MACYSGPNPIKDDERRAIWEWAKANGIDQGLSLKKVGDAINNHFFQGHAKPEWINDIITGRKTPFKMQTDAAWRAQANRRSIIRQAENISKFQAQGPVAKILHEIWVAPRNIATAGHNVVFPVSHGGDLAFRPLSYGPWIRRTLDTYAHSWTKAGADKVSGPMERDTMFTLALKGGLDSGASSRPSGLISEHFNGPADRAWQILKVMRFDIWKQQMLRNMKPDFTPAEMLDMSKHIAEWANHATGSGEGFLSNKTGAFWLFGPKLTQSKLNRIFADPVKTANTILNWKDASVGEKAVARIRVSGMVQYFSTYLAFLAINQGLHWALHTGVKVNWQDPTRSDWMQFKLGGAEAYMPGMHSELRTLAEIMAASQMSNKELRGESKQHYIGGLVGNYALNKTTPIIAKGGQALLGQDWMGRPLPWSKEPGTEKKPKLSVGEYAGTLGPIPLEGPVGYFYDHLRRTGTSAMDAMTIVKGFIISGVGLTGVHVKEEPPPAKHK